MKLVCKVWGLLAAIGAINWGLVALFNLDLVKYLFGSMPLVQNAVYILVGIAGLMLLVKIFASCDNNSCSQ